MNREFVSRPLRIEFPGGLYHITSRGNARAPIYFDDHDRQTFLVVLADVVARYRWACHAYCLMDNHYHLLIEIQDENLSRGMRQLNGVYTQKLNKRYTRVGHIFQGRYKAFVIEKDTYLLAVARYIVLNPVRAKAVRDPGDWSWSSYKATAGMVPSPTFLSTDWLLRQFAATRSVAQQKYREFVNEGPQKSPFKDLEEGVVLGFPQFIDYVRGINDDVKEDLEVPRRERSVGRPEIADLFEGVIDKEERRKAIELAHRSCGYSISEIARHLDLHPSTVSKLLSKNSQFKT